MKRITEHTARNALKRIKHEVLETPEVHLRDDVFVKLENLQPSGSFKIRGALNAIGDHKDVVTASAGNFGQALAIAGKQKGCIVTVVVPDHAPEAKLGPIRDSGARVVKVSYVEWWRILESSECPQFPDSVFIHPVMNSDVMAGNATIALELKQEYDAIFVPYGGGALSCGIASVVKELYPNTKVFSCEPETAAPLSAAFKHNAITEIDWRPSFVDGCGGKRVLLPMWVLARELLDGAIAVPLDDIADSVRLLAKKRKVIAEGAGACSVAAALKFKGRALAIVSGGGIDHDVLANILLHQPVTIGAQALGIQFFSAAAVEKHLDVKDCIEEVELSLIALAQGDADMPVRSVYALPNRRGVLAQMPAYNGGHASTKLLSVMFHDNGSVHHQGVVALFDSTSGAVRALADATSVTGIRTAAATAVATRLLVKKTHDGVPRAQVVALLGAGKQAKAHIEALACVLPHLDTVQVWNRSSGRLLALEEWATQRFPQVKFVSASSVADAVLGAEVVCALTPGVDSAKEPVILRDDVVAHLHPDVLINAVGACRKPMREVAQGVVFAASHLFCDSVGGCKQESADFEEVWGKKEVRTIGELLAQGAYEHPGGMTIFKSLGLGVFDLAAIKVLEKTQKGLRVPLNDSDAA